MARDITEILLGFARVLRAAGVDATPDRVQTMIAAADQLGADSGYGVYWAGRLALCSTADDLPVYDAAFEAYFGGRVPHSGNSMPSVVRRRNSVNVLIPAQQADGGAELPSGDPAPVLFASDQEILRRRDAADLTPPERDEVRRLIAMFEPQTAPRRTRRFRTSLKGPVDPNRTIRNLLKAGGEPARLARRRRRPKPRRLILLLDVSGSMAAYADTLLRFGHAAVRRHPGSTEVFTIGTRLTRITRPLRHRDADAALAAAGQAIPDWRGGTRLADAVKAFLDRWGRPGLAHGAVVVVCSDGWERGDPAELAEQVARLSRLAYRLIWVNPHQGKPGYAPLVGGIAAVLPYVDDFKAGHSLAALEDVVEVIARA